MDGQTGLVQVMSVDDRLLQGQGEIGDPITHVLNLDVILTVIHGAGPPRPSSVLANQDQYPRVVSFVARAAAVLAKRCWKGCNIITPTTKNGYLRFSPTDAESNGLSEL